MKTQLALTAALVAAVFSHGALAQASSPTRAEVKAQARTGSLVPAGEGAGATTGASSQANGKSTKTRMERKDETKMARDAGTLKPAGEAADLKQSDADRAKGTTKSRMERKEETKAAVKKEGKAGGTQPAGEAPQPSGEAPKK